MRTEAPPVPRTRRQWEDHWATYVETREERDRLLAEVERFWAERHAVELAEREAEEAACREIALREAEAAEVYEATLVVGPEPWAVAIFPADHTTRGWRRDNKAQALQDMEEGEVEMLVVKSTSGQDAIRRIYEARLDEIKSKKRRDPNVDFTDADGHYFAAPLFRPETEQAVLTGQWATNMEVLA